jgi:hypothetical protein
MPTRRIPIHLNLRPQISPRAVEAFRRLITLDQDDDEWLECERIIAREMQCRPWEFYCIKSPDEPAADHWDELAQARWAALAAAL